MLPNRKWRPARMRPLRNRLPFTVLGVLAFALCGVQIAATGERQPVQAAIAAQTSANFDTTLGPAYRFERGGWIYVHLEGSPHNVGVQHGYLLAPEIADVYG